MIYRKYINKAFMLMKCYIISLISVFVLFAAVTFLFDSSKNLQIIINIIGGCALAAIIIMIIMCSRTFGKCACPYCRAGKVFRCVEYEKALRKSRNANSFQCPKCRNMISII